jgi:hypothetical protein
MIFRKYISLIVTFFFLSSNLGLSFNVHYCDDEVASITLNTATSHHEIEKSCCGVVEKDSKCCKNKLVKTADKSDHIIVKNFSLDSDYCILNTPFEFTNISVCNNFKKRELTQYSCDANAPPLYLLYSQFTLYA